MPSLSEKKKLKTPTYPEIEPLSPAHARGLLYVVVLCVCLFCCLSVCLSVPALAASASVETSKQRYLRVSLRLFLD